jgi:hypothetical protein
MCSDNTQQFPFEKKRTDTSFSNVSMEPATYQTELALHGKLASISKIVPHYGITVEYAQKLKFNLSKIMRNEKGNYAGRRNEAKKDRLGTFAESTLAKVCSSKKHPASCLKQTRD